MSGNPFYKRYRTPAWANDWEGRELSGFKPPRKPVLGTPEAKAADGQSQVVSLRLLADQLASIEAEEGKGAATARRLREAIEEAASIIGKALVEVGQPSEG